MDREQLIREFISAVGYMKNTKFNGTYHWILGSDDKNNWAIVLGWSDGFAENEKDEFTDETWRLCVKLAYQSRNNIMQCDYDIDWTMPYDETTGEVNDTELAIYPNTNLKYCIDWLLKCYATYNIAED